MSHTLLNLSATSACPALAFGVDPGLHLSRETVNVWLLHIQVVGLVAGATKSIVVDMGILLQVNNGACQGSERVPLDSLPLQRPAFPNEPL